MPSPDAVVVGSGPNGLAAAIVLAQAGYSVQVQEAADSAGGGTRSAPLTLPGFVHDVCSAVHPLALASPFFRALPLAEHGLRWIEPPVPLAHPFDDGPPALLARSTEATGRTLGSDAARYRSLIEPFVTEWERLIRELLAPPHWPRHPLLLARFGLQALRSVRGLAVGRFQGDRARALTGGLGAHAAVPLTWRGSGAIGLLLAAAGHAVGWPIPAGGSQALANALASYFRSLGGTTLTSTPVCSLAELPPCSVILLDLTPRQVLRIAATNCHQLIAGRWNAFAMGRVPASSIGLSGGRCRGRRRRAPWLRLSISAGVSRRSSGPRRHHGRCGMRRVRSSFLRSRASSIRHEPLRDSTPPGRTVMSPTARPSI